MFNNDHIDTFVLQEFRLRVADSADEAARIVASFPGGIEPAVPLLTSIDDRRDVATVRALHAGEVVEADPGERAALEPLVASWQPPRHYGPRITERSESSPTYYRLAVTESGINKGEPRATTAVPRQLKQAPTSEPVGLLWIGRPIGTFAGLLTLVGSDGGRDEVRPDARVWPLPVSRPLGVRIYESRR